MASKFQLQIITPNRIFFEGEVERVILRAVDGDIGILKNHTPLVTPLSIGKVRITQEGQLKEAAIAGGFVHVDKEKTVVITDAAEWPEEIDLERANEAKYRAEERLKTKDPAIDRVRAEIALKKALNRINVAEKR